MSSYIPNVIEPPAPPTCDDIVAALESARLLIAAGWTQHRAVAVVDGRVCFCLTGAITAASRTTAIRAAAIAATRLALPVRFYNGSLEAFNDHQHTAAHDVTYVLGRAKGLVGMVIAA